MGEGEFGNEFEEILDLVGFKGLMEEERFSGLLGGVKEQHQVGRNPRFFRRGTVFRPPEFSMTTVMRFFFPSLFFRVLTKTKVFEKASEKQGGGFVPSSILCRVLFFRSVRIGLSERESGTKE